MFDWVLRVFDVQGCGSYSSFTQTISFYYFLDSFFITSKIMWGVFTTKKLHLRYLAAFWLHICNSNKKNSLTYFHIVQKQVKKEESYCRHYDREMFAPTQYTISHLLMNKNGKVLHCFSFEVTLLLFFSKGTSIF